MSRSEALLALLLAIGVAEAVVLAARAVETPPVLLPLLLPGDDPTLLGGPGGSRLAVRSRAVAIGDYVTLEDLARGALAAADGQLPGAAPLSDTEKARLRALVAEAASHRDELLRHEQEAAAASARMDEAARALLGTLDADQRAWILAHRDEISVGGFEDAYWEELRAALEAP